MTFERFTLYMFEIDQINYFYKALKFSFTRKNCGAFHFWFLSRTLDAKTNNMEKDCTRNRKTLVHQAVSGAKMKPIRMIMFHSAST